MSTIFTSGNFTLTIDDLTWGEAITAGTTIATMTLENPDGLSYLEYYGYNVESWDTASNTNLVYDGVTYQGAIEFSGETSATIQLVASVDMDFSSLDELNLYAYLFGADWSEESTIDFDVTVNEAPDNIALSTSDIAEDAVDGSVIGTLSATDAESDDLTYALSDDADGLFKLVTENGVTSLVLNGALDYETAVSHDVEVTVSDGDNEVRKTLTIAVTDVEENAPPTDIAISSTTILESARTGFTVGVLSAEDPEGDTITWSLVERTDQTASSNNNDRFALKTNDDGTTSVVLTSPLDHESDDGIYHLVLEATDSAGNSITKTIDIESLDDPFKLSAVPTGKDYVGIVETAKVGQEIGYVLAFDSSFTPVSATLTDDADGAFAIKTRVVGDETRYYLVTNQKLDYETADAHAITTLATDADGNTQEKTINVNVLDAAEAGDAPRGTIVINASTALAGENGGINWNTYLDKYFDNGAGGVPVMEAEEYLYSFADLGYEYKLSVQGSDLTYNPMDPITGEDTHTVSGAVTDLVFGEGTAEYGSEITKTELSISGLTLENDSTPLQRIYGDVNAVVSAFMHGEDSAYPSQLAQVKEILSSYAQVFKGSKEGDVYTGTVFDDTVQSKGDDDRINGAAGADKLRGGKGDDVVKGGSGDDHLYGNKGADELYGNRGADTFHFVSKSDSKKASYDTIHDFDKRAGDRIDLSGIDADSGRKGDQDFTFIGSQDFHDKAGELHFAKSKGETIIEGDINGDGKADFVLYLDDAMRMNADLFVL